MCDPHEATTVECARLNKLYYHNLFAALPVAAVGLSQSKSDYKVPVFARLDNGGTQGLLLTRVTVQRNQLG